MLRRFWIFLAIAISLFVGYQAEMRAPGLIDWFTTSVLGGAAVDTLNASGYIALTWAATLVTTSVFVLVFLVLAIGDGLKLRRVMLGLEQLREGRNNGEEPTIRNFLATFGEAEHLARMAADYAATLHAERPDRAGPDAKITYRATVPATTCFGTASQVDARLYLWFFHRLPTALSVLGALGLAAGLLIGIDGFRLAAANTGWAEASLEPLITGVQGGLIALFLAGALALLIGIVQNVILAARYQQNAQFCHDIDALFRFGVEAEYLRDLAATTRGETIELRRAVVSAADDLKAELGHDNERLLKAVAEQAKISADALGAAVHKALAEPISAIAAATEHVADDQGARVKDLIEEAVTGFLAELEKRFGDQLANVDHVLTSSQAAAGDMRDAFSAVGTDMARQMSGIGDSFAAELRSAIEAERDRHSEDNQALAAQIETLTSTLAGDVAAHSKHFDNLLQDSLQRVEEITHSALYTSSEDLAKTAVAFSGLQSVVESLALSVTPILNQVADTQGQLLDAIGEEASAGRLIAKAAKDMNAAARASRETVERFVILATRLSETSKTFLGHGGVAELGATPIESGRARRKKSPKPVPTEGLSQALMELRDESEDASEQLPKL